MVQPVEEKEGKKGAKMQERNPLNNKRQVEPELSLKMLEMTKDLVANYINHNKMNTQETLVFIKQVYETLLSINHTFRDPKEALQPAIDVKSSVTPDYLVCLEDGQKFKMLKRHLRTTYNISPEQYRIKWDLPADYPMVAPNYARERSKLAKDFGLGTNMSRERGKLPKKARIKQETRQEANQNEENNEDSQKSARKNRKKKEQSA